MVRQSLCRSSQNQRGTELTTCWKGSLLDAPLPALHSVPLQSMDIEGVAAVQPSKPVGAKFPVLAEGAGTNATRDLGLWEGLSHAVTAEAEQYAAQ